MIPIPHAITTRLQTQVSIHADNALETLVGVRVWLSNQSHTKVLPPFQPLAEAYAQQAAYLEVARQELSVADKLLKVHHVEIQRGEAPLTGANRDTLLMAIQRLRRVLEICSALSGDFVAYGIKLNQLILDDKTK